ncbi:MAG: hypothetical protein ACOCRX_11335 [Candidatus Woesearchaeota archaeon]
MKKNRKILVGFLLFIIAITFISCKTENSMTENDQQVKKNENVEYVEKELLVKKKEVDHKIGMTVIDNYKYNDYGKVIELDREIIGEGDKKDAEFKFYYVYDDHQRRIKEIREDQGEKVVLEKYKYDENGNEVYNYQKLNEHNEEEEIKRKYNDKNQLVKKITNKEGFQQVERFKYDQQGNQIEERDIRKEEGKVVSKFRIISKYDQQQRKINEKAYRNGELLREKTWDYDQYGNKIVDKEIGEESLSGKKYCEWHEYKYDKEGNLLKKVEKNRDGVIVDGEIKKYNKQGNNVKKILLGKKGEKTRKYIKSYNKDDKKRKLIIKDDSGKLVSITQFLYDNQGNQIGYITKNRSGKITDKSEYEYNRDGQMIKETWINIENGKEVIDQIREYKYDQYGNKTYEIRKNGNGLVLWEQNREYYGKDSLKGYETDTKRRTDEGEIISKHFEKWYDKKENITKEIDIFNGKTRINQEYDYEYKKIKVREES